MADSTAFDNAVIKYAHICLIDGQLDVHVSEKTSKKHYA